jgi:ketosteroid isomerase-like protein
LMILDAGAAQRQNSAEHTVRSLDDEERIAALKRDTAALERLWSDQFVANGPNNKVVADKQALLNALVPRSSYERQIEFFRVDGDFAFVMGLETLVPVTDAPSVGLVADRPTRRRFTNVWKREAGTWRLYARHANVIADR